MQVTKWNTTCLGTYCKDERHVFPFSCTYAAPSLVQFVNWDTLLQQRENSVLPLQYVQTQSAEIAVQSTKGGWSGGSGPPLSSATPHPMGQVTAS